VRILLKDVIVVQRVKQFSEFIEPDIYRVHFC